MATRKLSTPAVLMGSMSVVVLSFLAGLVYLARLSTLVGRETTSIATYAKPSTDELVAALGEVRKIDAAMDRNLLAMASHRPVGSSLVEKTRRVLDEDLTRYLSLPDYGREADLQGELSEAHRGFDAASERMMEIFREGDLPAAYQYEDGTWRDVSDRLDAAIHELIVFNLARMEDHTDRLEQTWRRALTTALSMGLFNLLLALLATWLAMRAIRSREMHLENRAAELEIFAGRVAHDVMGPLSTMGMALQVASKRGGGGTVAQMAELGLSSMRQLQGIVDALLGFARAGGQPVPGRASVAEAVTAQIEALRPLAEERHIELSAGPAPVSEVAVPPGILSVLLSNLLRNAVKYMGDSEIRRVRLEAIEGPQTIRFEVQDTGPGIDPAFRGRIFDAFFQGPRSAGGIGLGLATVKRLTDAYGGRLGFDPRDGGGTVFWFELARAEATGLKSAQGGPLPPRSAAPID